MQSFYDGGPSFANLIAGNKSRAVGCQLAAIGQTEELRAKS
jgi:hypothetical protein